MWSSPRIIMFLLRIIEKIKLGTSVTPTPRRVKEIRLRPCPVKFWVSLRMKIPQPLSVPGPVSDHPHDKRKKKKKHTTFFLLSNQNFPCYNCPVTMCFQEQCGSVFSVHSPQVLEEARRILKTLPTSQMRNNTLRWRKMATEALQCLMVRPADLLE